MRDFDDEGSGKSPAHAATRQPLVVRVTDSDERNDIKRGVYDRLLNAVITVAISMVIALHDRWWK